MEPMADAAVHRFRDTLICSTNISVFKFMKIYLFHESFFRKGTILSFLSGLIILLFVGSLNISAQNKPESTKVTLRETNGTLKSVLNEIERQTDFLFVSNSNDVNLDWKVTVNFNKQPLDSVLDDIFGEAGITWKIEGVNIMLTRNQEYSNDGAHIGRKKITGRVTDAGCNPIVGAGVVERGTMNGAISDNNGEFSILVNPKAVLDVSCIGYKNFEVKIGESLRYEISMSEDSKLLDEIVVIGYGTVKKRDLTGSVGSVRAKDLSAIPQASAELALQGRIAGVQVRQSSGAPGKTPTIRIRGTNSILGDNSPLYVIDGFPSNVGSGILNVDDIESVEILKDASAIAIYGSRGSNGVVIITTKKGKEGKTTVEFGTTYGIQKVSKKMDVMNASEYARFYNERAKNDGREPFFTDEQINSFGEGFDWQNFIYKKAPLRTHSLTVSGGNEKTKFSISGNFFGQDGIVGKGSYDRYTVRSNISHDITKRLNVELNTTLSRSITDNKDSEGGSQGGTLTSVSLLAPPVCQPYNDDGSYAVLEGYYPVITTGGGIVNPLNILNLIDDKTKRNRVLANAAFTYQPIDGLYIKISGGVENTDARNDYYRKNGYYNATSYASVSTTQQISFLNENTINYVKTIAQKHNLSALAGFTYQDYKYTSLNGSGSGFLSDITSTGNLSSAATPGIPSSSYTKWVLLSSIARINYDYDHKYLLTFSFRADGSSRYSKGDKWGYFPSGAIAWKIGDETFMSNLSWLSDLKLRASYGVSGNQAITPYSTLNNLYSGKTVFSTDLYTFFAPGSILPSRLKWESTSEFDAGLDASFLNDRLSVTADYYHKLTRDLLNSVPLPNSTGYGSTIRNVGKIQNQGFEFSFNAHLIDKEFQWTLDGNLSLNRSKVKKLQGGNDILGGWIGFLVINDNASILREGEPMSVFFGYRTDGYDENGFEKYKDLHEDGVINSDDKTIIGDPNPDFTYGLNSYMSYKGFELSLFFQGSQGNDMLNATSIDNTLYCAYGVNQLKEVLYDHWTPENTDAKYPKPVTGLSMRLSDRLIEDASYLRLRNLEFGYNFPVEKWNIDWVKKIKLYMSLQNILTITHYSGWDPDVNSQSGIGVGIDQNPYPMAKSYTFGINVTF